jgi:hypothetical protein
MPREPVGVGCGARHHDADACVRAVGRARGKRRPMHGCDGQRARLTIGSERRADAWRRRTARADAAARKLRVLGSRQASDATVGAVR